MPLDPRAKRFLDRLAALSPASVLDLSVEERRSGLRQLMSFAGPGAAIRHVAERTLTGPDGEPLRLRIYRPDESPAPAPALIYFHGGGLVAGSLDTHDPICRSLSNSSCCVILSVDYRLAPEHPFPAAIADGRHATAWIAAHARELGIDPARLGICGDSAGATLAAVVCQSVCAAGEVRLALQFLLCPIMDFAAVTASWQEYARGYLLDRETLEHDLKHYLGAAAQVARKVRHPQVSPLRVENVSALPPTCIHTAEFDPLRDEGAAYAERLRAAGIQTTYRCHSGMIHLFYGMGALIPYASTAWQLVGTDIRSLLGGAPA